MAGPHQEGRSRRLLLACGWGAAILGAACLWAEFTPIASPLDTRPAGLALALAALVLALWSVRPPRRTWRAALALGVAAAAVAVFAVWLLWLSQREEQLRFANGAVSLSGTLYLPPTPGPHPALLFLHGSGPELRTEFRYHGKLFARHGIAALTYDKRGAGESGGRTYDGGYEAYARDALAAVRLLQARPDIRADSIGIFGQSEGGWVAPLLVQMFPQCAFVVVTSSTPLSPAGQVLYETGSQLRRSGFADEAARQAADLQARVLAYQRTGGGREQIETDLRRAVSEPWFAAADLPEKLWPPEDYAWWRGVMDFDPVPLWRQVRCPVLAVNGGLDLKSEAAESQRLLRDALASGGNPRFTGRIYPAMEHGTIEWRLPGRLPPPLFPKGYPELLVGWVLERLDARELPGGAAP